MLPPTSTSRCEISPAEAVKNNVFGTKNLLTSASEHGVERLVQLSPIRPSTPPASWAAPSACVRCSSRPSRNTDMKCVAVRFGNVLGSHGSVIPLFEAQIKKGGPVTLTDANIERYFMTIPEAAQLVLQAGALAESGSIYVLDMGEPVKIMDLAKQLIRFYGYEPGVNMDIKIVGLRPGEKLYEELMMDEEQDKMRCTVTIRSSWLRPEHRPGRVLPAASRSCLPPPNTTTTAWWSS